MKLIQTLDLKILALIFLIGSLGLVQLSSLDIDLFTAQLRFFSLGFILYFTLVFLGKEVIRVFTPQFFLLSLVLLLLTLVIGYQAKGATRWIDLKLFNLQPSELAKLALITSLAYYLSGVKKGILGTTPLLKTFLILSPIAILTFIQPDLGTTLVIFGTFSFMLLMRGVSPRFVLILFIVFGLMSGSIWSSMRDYQKDRILVFLNPNLDPLGSGYNVIQAKVAIGSGQFFGKGYGNGTQSRLRFLPEYHTDFIFASFAEEWGFVGVSILVALYLILLTHIYFVGLSKRADPFSSLCAFGVFAMLSVQFVINVGMNLGVMPVTGIPLPFVSYGGSSIITSFAALGLVNSIKNI